MSFQVILTLALALCASSLVLLLVRRLTSAGAISECDPEWIANFSIASYRPMLRLLSEDDYKFFAAQPGVTPKAVEQFRRERRRVFKSYLRNLVTWRKHFSSSARSLHGAFSWSRSGSACIPSVSEQWTHEICWVLSIPCA